MPAMLFLGPPPRLAGRRARARGAGRPSPATEPRSAPEAAVRQLGVGGEDEVVGRAAEGDAIRPVGDVPLAGVRVVAGEQPRVGGEPELARRAGGQLDALEAEQAQAAIAGGFGEIELGDVGAVALTGVGD